MVKYGIIADTHINANDDPNKVKTLIDQLKEIFKDVDEIIHAGDICDEDFLKRLKEIAPTKCVTGNMDYIDDLEDFIKFSAGSYNIGVIHELPENLEAFFKEHGLHILITGHTHQTITQGTKYNTLILNPGSPTSPKAPPPKRGFLKPVARPTVITMKIDEDTDIISTYTINLKI